MFTKDLQELKLKLKIKEMNNTLQGINSRITEAEEWINDLQYRMVEITATEQNIEKRMKRNESLRDLWDNVKCTNIRIIGVPEREEKQKGSEKISEEIRAENVPNMGKERVNQVQEVQSPMQYKPKEEHTENDKN